MTRDINYYLSKGLDERTARYYASGRKKIINVEPHEDYSLTITFDNGERRWLDCKTFIKDGTIFEVLKNYNIFKRVYVDDTHSIAWDKDANVDSEKVWSNKIDICPDSSYLDSVPIEGEQYAG